MPFKKILKFSLLSFLFLNICPTLSHATNGYFASCVGAKNCGMGGAGVALVQDASSGAINPALLARTDSQGTLTLGWFHPERTMHARGPLSNPVDTKQSSRNQDFFIGSGALNYKINSNWAIGVALWGNGGMATSYRFSRTNPAFHPAPAGGNYDKMMRYRLLNVTPTIAWKPSKRQAYGFSTILGYSDFKSDIATLPTFAQTVGANELDRAFGIGFRIGGLWDLNERLTLGASVSSPVWFQKFDKYDDLFPDSMDTPPHFQVGFTSHLSNKTVLATDLKYIFWDQVNVIGASAGLKGFAWENTAVLMIGLQHQFNDNWTGRIGLNYGGSPIEDDKVFANALSPAVIKQHYTLGGTYHLSDKTDLSFSGFFAPEQSQTESGTGDAFSAGGVGTEVTMWQTGVRMGAEWKF